MELLKSIELFLSSSEMIGVVVSVIVIVGLAVSVLRYFMPEESCENVTISKIEMHYRIKAGNKQHANR